MPFINVWPSHVRCLVIGSLLLGFSALTPQPSFAQTPGTPQVTVLADNSVVVTYDAPALPPAGTLLAVTFNGGSIGPFPIGTATSVYSGAPVPPGDYTVQVLWGGGVSSPVSAFVVGGSAGSTRPGPTIMRPAQLAGNSVALTWDPIANATGYEVEATLFETGQTFHMTVGNQTGLVVPNVPSGNYSARVRGRNSLGVGPYSNQILVAVGTTIRLRDLEVTLTWNSLADLDLHIIEPDGTHVSWEHRRGVTTRLETDNTTGFGPETAFVPQGGAALGVYQVFFVHYRGAFPTTATIAISLNVGTPSVQTTIFTRQSSEGSASDGYNVALVDVTSGVIGEIFGSRSVGDQRSSVKPQ